MTTAIGGITWNGQNSADLGLAITYDSSQLAGGLFSSTLTQIGGQSAAVIQANNRFDNVPQVFNLTTYRPVQQSDIAPLHRAVESWLFAGVDLSQYQRLAFDGYPDYYWRAVPSALTPFSITGMTISFTVTFSCIPYAYETGSNKYQPVSSGQIIKNPRLYSALPLWHVKGTGNGSFVLNNVTFNFLGLSGDLYIDSDNEEVYDASNNYQPGMVQFDNYVFPILATGDNTFGTLTNISLEVMPRWRTLL